MKFKLSSLPSTLQGTFYLIATVKDSGGSTTGVAGPTFTIAAPVVTIGTSHLIVSPASIKPGKKLTLSLTLQDTGNILTSGTAALTISLSTDPTGAAGQTVATMPLKVKLKPRQSKSYKVKFTLPAGTTAGTYYVAGSLAVSALHDPTAADGFAVSGTQITVG